MTKKIKTLIFLNLFFISLAIYAIYLFSSNKTFSADYLVEKSILKEKTFDARVVEIESKSRLKAWLMEEHSTPIVALNFYFDKSGYGFEEKGKLGVSQMVAELLSYGTTDYPYEIYHDLLETNGISINFATNYETFNISMTAPKENLKTAEKLLKSVLTNPKFQNKDIEVVRKQLIELIRMQDEKPEKVIAQNLKEELYGSHPKARLALGKIDDVFHISKQDLYTFCKENFATDNLHIAIAGDISKEDAIDLLDFIFDNLKSRKTEISMPEVRPNYTFKEKNIERSIPQVISYFVAPGTKRLAPDFYALYIANEIFGGSGLSSRLNLMAREKEGLTYGAYTYLNPQKDAPQIEGTFSTSKQNYKKMREILLSEWQKMADKGVTQEEVETVKNNMLASFNLRFKSISDIATQLLYMQKEGLEIDFLNKRNQYVRNTGLDEVNEAAKKYYQNKPSILTIGNNK